MNYYYPQGIDSKAPAGYPGLAGAAPRPAGAGMPNGAGIPGLQAGIPGGAGMPMHGLSGSPGVPGMPAGSAMPGLHGAPGVPRMHTASGLPNGSGGPGLANEAGSPPGLASSQALSSAYHQSQQPTAGGTSPSPSGYAAAQAQAHAEAQARQYASLTGHPGFAAPASSYGYSFYQPTAMMPSQASLMGQYAHSARGAMGALPLASTTHTAGYYSPAGMTQASIPAASMYGYSGLSYPSIYGPPMAAYATAPQPSHLAQSPGLAPLPLGSSQGFPPGSIYARQLP